MPSYCIICGSSKQNESNISLYRIPKKPELRQSWLAGLNLVEEDVTKDSRVCSKHFRDGNSRNIPSIFIGKKFADLPSMDTDRGKHRATREKKVREQLSMSPRDDSMLSQPLAHLPSSTPDISVCNNTASHLPSSTPDISVCNVYS